MDYNQEYVSWLTHHQNLRTGERLRRLSEGHAHAEQLFIEKVWWPAFGHFKNLHPEYEVHDFNNGIRYLDFAYIHPIFRVAIEVDGYNSHNRDLNRWQFSDQLRRQNHLVIDGWHILRFSYDIIESKPRICQQEIQQLLGKWLGENFHLPSKIETQFYSKTNSKLTSKVNPKVNSQSIGRTLTLTLTLTEKEIIRLAIRLNRPLAPADVSSQLNISTKVSRRLLQSLVHKSIFAPHDGHVRIRNYKLTLNRKRIIQNLNLLT